MERLNFSLAAYSMFIAIIVMGVFFSLIFTLKRSKKKTKTIQYKLSGSEQLFSEFTENIHQVLWRFSINTHKFTFISSYATQVFGQPVDLINKDEDSWLRYIIPEDKPKIMAAINQVKQGVSDINLDIKILRADGVIAVLSNQLFPSKNRQGTVIAVLGIISDITAQYNLALQKRLRAELHKNLNQLKDMKNLSYITLKSIGLAINYDIGELWIFDDKEKKLVCLVHWSRDNLEGNNKIHEVLSVSDKTKNTFQVICLNHKIIQYSTHAMHLKTHYTGVDGAEINLKEVVGIPIVVSNKPIGVLCFYNRQILNLDIDGYKILLEFAEEFGEYIHNKLLMKQLKYSAVYDALTGLYNRFSLVKKIREMIKNNVQPITVIKLRLNNFQLINYALGYDVGNKILQEMSKKITDFLSSYSSPLSSIDFVAIAEPGIFCFLSHQFDEEEGIIDFVTKLLDLFKKPIKKNNIEIFLSASIGISRYPQNGTTPDQLLGSAILAVIQSSNEGGNRFKFATQDILKSTSQNIEIENAMHHALGNNELELFYQPKVSLNTGKIVGVEALIRWHESKNTIRSPDYFIPVCEQTDLILEINEWVLDTVM